MSTLPLSLLDLCAVLARFSSPKNYTVQEMVNMSTIILSSSALWNLLAVQWSGWTRPPFCMVCGAGNQGQVGVLIPSLWSVHSDLLKNVRTRGAATLRWILQQLHSKTVLAHIGAFPNKCTIKHPFHKWKSGNLWKLHHSVLSGKNKLFYNITVTQNHTWHIPKVIEITIYIRNNFGTTPFCHVLCLWMHINVMHRFMVQAFQDPPFCSSTVLVPVIPWLLRLSKASFFFCMTKVVISIQRDCPSLAWNYVMLQ